MDGDLTFTSLAGGGSHTCGLTAAGVAYCWGNNFSGQLGRTAGNEPGDPNPTPAPIDAALAFTSLAAGSTHTCGVATDGVAWCWGNNIRGQLGTTVNNGSDAPTPPQARAARSPSPASSRAAGIPVD
ncbi:MAG TPA: hypothetical protein VMN37_02285 [Gemmatimonadales bacterium]|nr:hypothetical protein [Gemmatimonadales bacterium]